MIRSLTLLVGLALGMALPNTARADGPGPLSGVDLRFSLAPSTNITGGTGAETVLIGGLPFTLDPGSRAEPGVGVNLGFTAWQILGRGPNGQIALAASVDRHVYSTDLVDDKTDYALRLTFNRRFQRGKLSFGPHLEMTEENGTASRHRLGFGLSGERMMSPRLRLSYALDRVHQTYPGAEFRDGDRTSVQARIDYALRPNTKLSVDLPLLRETAVAPHLAHRDWEVGLGVSHDFASGLGLGLRVGAGQAEYDGIYPGFDFARSDRSASATLTIRHEALQWHGLTPELSVTRRFTDSTVPLHDTAATELGLTFVRRF